MRINGDKVRYVILWTLLIGLSLGVEVLALLVFLTIAGAIK
jgi:hypothetical protein